MRSSLSERCYKLLVLMPIIVAVLTVCVGADDNGPVLVVPNHDQPLQIALMLPDGLDVAGPGCATLVEIDRPDTIVQAQLAAASTDDGAVATGLLQLVASISPRTDAGSERRFRIQSHQEIQPGGFRLQDLNRQSVGLFEGDEPVLVYNHGVITHQDVPEGDQRRSRACYIHPVYGLSGEVLTEDFPRDHYHHHGIFWTWPHVRIRDQEYDLWADRGIKQKFVTWLGRQMGPAAGIIGVENGWFVGDKKVMIERVWIRAYRPAEKTRSLDLEFTWIPVEEPLTLWGAGGKSYGGLTVRFAPPSRNDPNTVITVPSGRTSGDLPDTPLEWADFTSRFGEMPNPSGAAVFVHPKHPDYPPTWLTRHYGPLCVGWPGVKPMTFAPGKPIRLNYRVWIHKGPVATEEIAGAHDAYESAVTGVQMEGS